MIFTDDEGGHFFARHWIPQGEALTHPAVACAMLHCGFGGMTDAISAGKPVLAWPAFAD